MKFKLIKNQIKERSYSLEFALYFFFKYSIYLYISIFSFLTRILLMCNIIYINVL